MSVKSHLKPSSHLVGTSNSMVLIQSLDFKSFMIHLRFEMVSMMAPDISSLTVMTTFSIGSSLCQSTSLKITCGAQTCNSRHSLRILSISTDKCISPLPETINFPSSISTLRPTFVSVSFSSLSARFLVVIYFHSLPANGESFTRNSIFNVGSSIVIAGRALTSHTHIVSHTKIEGIPLIVIISPQSAFHVSILWSQRVVKILAILPVLTVPSFQIIVTVSPALAVHS